MRRCLWSSIRNNITAPTDIVASHIAVITGTRADWGLLSPAARVLRDTPDVRVSVVATNMHLSARHGHTVDAIVAEGFDVTHRVPVPEDLADDGTGRAHAAAICLAGVADALAELRADTAVILGDRFEALAAAQAAVLVGVPVTHLHGGETTRGAVDDCLRHAITKLASLHLCATDEARRRIIQMGEQPDSVVTVGAPGVYNALNMPKMTAAELGDSLGGFAVSRSSTLLVTYHPETNDRGATPAERFAALLEALDRFEDCNIILTGVNNDAGASGIRALAAEYAAANPRRVRAVESLGARRYLSAMAHCAAVVGNSSSGIIEAPSMHVTTIDIGGRQAGRQAADSVIHCGVTADDIADAIRRALGDEARRRAADTSNPYYHADTPQLIASTILAHLPMSIAKTFHDISHTI